MRIYQATFSFAQEADAKSTFAYEHSLEVSVIEPELSQQTYLVFKTDRWTMDESELDSLGLKLKRLLRMARTNTS